MSGMTPERLAEIEDRLPDFIRPGTPEHDVLDLIDEVMRLRAIESGVKALADWWQRSPGDGGYEVACEDHARQVLALLNPTEGETDG